MVNTLKKGLIKRSIIYKKRGLSEIIATLVTILLVLVAVGIVWGVIKNVIKNQTEQISLGKLTLDIEIKKASIINESFAQVSIKRNPGEGDFKSIKVIFDDGEETEIIEIKESLTELQEKTYLFELKNLNASELEKISIAPVFIMESGKEIIGEVKDEHKIKHSTVSSCTPNCSGKNCGSNGCGGNCGTCSSGYTCNSTGQCVLVAGCTPGTCVGKNCGSWANGTCAGTLNCGTCSSGYTCNSTGQCVTTGGETPSWQTGMILWLKLEGNSLDSSSYNWSSNATGITYTSGMVGQGATGFTSTNKINVSSSLDYASTDMTIAFWMRVTNIASPSRQNPIGKAYGGDGTFTLEPDGHISLFFGSSGGNSNPYTNDQSGAVTNNTWEHWIITRNRSTRTTQWYKNGVASGSAFTYNSTYDPVHSTNLLTIGDNYVNPLNGAIDEVMIWNRTLNSIEIQQVYGYTG